MKVQQSTCMLVESRVRRGANAGRCSKSYDSEQEIDEHGLYLFKTTEIFYLSIVTVAS